MKEKKIKKYKVYRYLIILLFLIGGALIALYPFRNQDLTIEIITNGEKISTVLSSGYVSDNDKICFDFSHVKQLEVKEIRIYRQIKSICLQRIHYGELPNYMQNSESSYFEWTTNGATFIDENGVHIVMNDVGSELIKSLSSSVLLERILMAELWMMFCVVILSVGEMHREKTSENSYRNFGLVFEAKRFFADMKKYWSYMLFSAKADLRAEVANSYLNRLWWLLEPFFNMLVYVVVFGHVLGRSIENYATFTFSALLMWNFFNKTLNYSVKLIRNNRDIVTKVYVPKCVLLVSNMILNFYKLLFSLIVLIPMLLIFRVHIGINIIWIVPAYIMMILLSFGLGMIFLHFGVYIDDLSYAVGILLQMLMFLSGIFYEVLTSLTAPLNMIMICLNPAAVFIDTMRNALLYNRVVNLPILGIWTLGAIILCCVGVHIVYKNENGYVKVV
ncbi:MAG: ABC transporter permease [Lachnospiraceae bacterium]|nr:ABC transporter permease [Lachnospiraceae bacterium]